MKMPLPMDKPRMVRTFQGVDDKKNKVGETEDTPGVDDAEETLGADDETTAENPGVYDESLDEIGDKSVYCTSSGMSLCIQSLKDYNHNSYNDNVFNITGKIQNDGIILLIFKSENFKITEEQFNEADAEYMFLTRTLEWKDGLNKENDPTPDTAPGDVTKLAKYLLLTKHTG
jgi:hypothetical protein